MSGPWQQVYHDDRQFPSKYFLALPEARQRPRTSNQSDKEWLNQAEKKARRRLRNQRSQVRILSGALFLWLGACGQVAPPSLTRACLQANGQAYEYSFSVVSVRTLGATRICLSFSNAPDQTKFFHMPCGRQTPITIAEPMPEESAREFAQPWLETAFRPIRRRFLSIPVDLRR